MADIFGGIIFIVIFYFVFKTIWNNVTTVSYSGLEGFFKSWGNQVFWAFIITAIIITIGAKLLESVMDFGRGMNFGFSDVFIFGVVVYVLFAIFSSSDAFDKKSFRENYNNYVDSFGSASKIYDRMSAYKSSAEPGDKIAEGIAAEVRQGTPLNLTEEFLTNENGVKLINFPNATALYSDEDNEPHIIFMIDLWGDVNNNELERIFINIIITAAIAAVEPGKSDEIKRELKLINDDEPIFYLPPYNPEEKSENIFLAVSKATYNFSRFEDFVTFSIYIHN